MQASTIHRPDSPTIKQQIKIAAEKVQESRVVKVFHAVTKAYKSVSALVSSSAPSMISSQNILKAVGLFEPFVFAIKLVPYAAPLSVPFAVKAVLNSSKEREIKKTDESYKLHIQNISWLYGSLSASLTGISYYSFVSNQAKAVLRSVAAPLSILTLVLTLYEAKLDYSLAKKAWSLRSSLNKGYKKTIAQMTKDKVQETFNLKKYEFAKTSKDRKIHLEAFKKRLFSKTLSYALESAANIITFAALTILTSTLAIVPTLAIFAVGSLLYLSSIAIDQWSTHNLKVKLGHDSENLNKITLGITTVSLIAIPLLLAKNLKT